MDLITVHGAGDDELGARLGRRTGGCAGVGSGSWQGKAGGVEGLGSGVDAGRQVARKGFRARRESSGKAWQRQSRAGAACAADQLTRRTLSARKAGRRRW